MNGEKLAVFTLGFANQVPITIMVHACMKSYDHVDMCLYI